ncbi:MAG: MBL fold metallo-hydrolase [Candidatus Omnitrophota bacterium]
MVHDKITSKRKISLKFFLILSIAFAVCFAVAIKPTYSYTKKQKETVKVHVIDVGYGDSILIELPSKKIILIDTGTSEYVQEFIKYLEDIHIKDIDTLILTHPHENHFSGIESLIEKCKVHNFYINDDVSRAEEGYKEVMEKVKEKNIPTKVLKRGDTLFSDQKDIKLEILNPKGLSGKANENSIVSYFTFKDTSFLFTSDIQVGQQLVLITSFPYIKLANVVQVPHHGGFITDEFAGFFVDKIFIVSSGENKFHKPYQKELDKLIGFVLRTDVLGTIVLESDGENVKVVNED